MVKWGERLDIWKELQDEGIDAALLEEIRHFREAHPVPPEAQPRIPTPQCLYYGKEVWESAAAALLCGQHLLLAGPKATGKNVLAENLAAVFGRPVWDVSMYVNVDAAALIGADTLQDGQVAFREGPVCQCARLGGFGVLDEVNMAKSEALAVLHATLDPAAQRISYTVQLTEESEDWIAQKQWYGVASYADVEIFYPEAGSYYRQTDVPHLRFYEWGLADQPTDLESQRPDTGTRYNDYIVDSVTVLSVDGVQHSTFRRVGQSLLLEEDLSFHAWLQ